MARPMTPDQTLAAMRKWKVPFKEYPGWRTRSRPVNSSTPFSDIRGVVIHHTGSDAGQSDAYLEFLFVDGRSDVPGPLCQVATDMDGDLWLGANGRANHAGRGSSTVLTKVTSEAYAGYGTEIRPGPDDTDGNAHFYGNEVRYDGGQPMTSRQYATAVRWSAAICDHYGWTALSVIGHREWTTRKPDPGNCPMNQFRADVATLLKAGPPSIGVPRDVTVSMAALNMAARGEPQSATWWGDAKQFMAFAHAGIRVIPKTTFWAWHAAPFGAWRGKLFTYAIKCVQARARIKQTGHFDEPTAAYMRRFGYTVTD